MTVLDSFRLDGRVAVISGASSGLGVDFAVAPARAGADIVIAALDRGLGTHRRALVCPERSVDGLRESALCV